MVALNNGDGFYVIDNLESVKAKVLKVNDSELKTLIGSYQDKLFTPKSLGFLKFGQLSFADLEESILPNSFTLLLRHKAKLDKSLKVALENAHQTEFEHKLKSLNKVNITEEDSFKLKLEVYEIVLSVTTAFLAARILEDKGFFGEERVPMNNVSQLLASTASRTNGFFYETVHNMLPHLSDRTLQEIALHLGANVSFSLIDHLDVGRLYEQTSFVLESKLSGLKGKSEFVSQLPLNGLINLQRHYTPMSIAGRMLEALPLEKLRPEERRITDLAAGSGTLLSAGTLRLALMLDIPEGEARREYLRSKVTGNDKDPFARLITRLRYLLLNQSLNGKDTTLFENPDFETRDYNEFTSENIPGKPRVWIANPPFALKKTQQAFDFVEMVSAWMKDGDQFAFVLPDTFLNGQVQGAKSARKCLTDNAKILETWQLPEKAVGLSAEQSVCVVIGEVNKNHKPLTIARAVHSRIEARKLVAENGYLGRAWLTEVPEGEDSWSAVVSPVTKLNVPTISLSELYHAFVGVTLISVSHSIATNMEDEVNFKPYWQTNWREAGRLWADPENVDSDKKFVRYDRQYLRRMAESNKELFELPKILIARSMNRDTKDYLAPLLDDSGFFPDNSIFCVCSRILANKITNYQIVPHDWLKLNEYQKLMWLLGILSSDTARSILDPYRSPRNLQKTALLNFPLPVTIDGKIVAITEKLIEKDKSHQPLSVSKVLRMDLEKAVASSYGLKFRKKAEEDSGDVAVEFQKRNDERKIGKVVVTGQVLNANLEKNKILLYLGGISDEKREAWISLPYEMPGWAVEGDVFTADISEDIKTFAEISKRPWSMRNFRHSHRPYMSAEELKEEFWGTAAR